MTAPETEARQALEKALKETYAAEGFTVVPGRLNRSLGDAETIIGVYPERTAHAKDAVVNEMHIVIQFYGHWERSIERENVVDPAQIEEYVERFREKLRTGVDPRTGAVWYFMLDRTDFPGDPLGNATRYEMHVNARGANSALVETQ